MIDLRKLLIDGHAAQQAKHAAEEATKRGNLRAGTSGIVTADGKIFGNCHRIALNRLVGTEGEKDIPTLLMFAQGTSNEDRWLEVLKESWTGKILCESEIPVSIKLKDTQITGRPDMVLCDTAGKPELVIEHKAVCSSSTAESVHIFHTPDDKHLIQLAIYMSSLNAPGVLAYTNRNNFTPFYGVQKSTGIKKIRPFYELFHVRWEGDVLQYRHESVFDWSTTVITKQSIMDYYDLVLEMKDSKSLGPRPERDETVTGDERKWDPCKYCELARVCDQHESNYDDWIKASKGVK